VITIHQRYRRTDGQTDRQTTCDRNTALCPEVHRAVKIKGKKSVIHLLYIRSSMQWSGHLLSGEHAFCIGLQYRINQSRIQTDTKSLYIRITVAITELLSLRVVGGLEGAINDV